MSPGLDRYRVNDRDVYSTRKPRRGTRLVNRCSRRGSRSRLPGPSPTESRVQSLHIAQEERRDQSTIFLVCQETASPQGTPFEGLLRCDRVRCPARRSGGVFPDGQRWHGRSRSATRYLWPDVCPCFRRIGPCTRPSQARMARIPTAAARRSALLVAQEEVDPFAAEVVLWRIRSSSIH